MKIQLSSGTTCEVDTAHALAGQTVVIKNGLARNAKAKVLGIRKGAKANERLAFVIELPGCKYLISRVNFETA